MEFTIERAELARLVKHAGRTVEARNTIPVLGMLLLEAADGLTVTATDLDIVASAAGEADVATAGAACVDAKLLTGIVGKAGGSDISFLLDGDILHLKSGRSTLKLFALPASDFPNKNSVEFDTTFEADLNALFRGVSFAMSNEEARFYLNSVFLRGEGGFLTAAATDGHRLAHDRVSCDAEFEYILFPRKAVGLVPDGVCEVSVSSNTVRVVQGGLSLITQLIAGNYPDYERVIPSDNEKLATINRDDALKASDRVVAIGQDRGAPVKLSVAPGAISFWSRSPLGEANDEIQAEYSDEPVSIGLNSLYLKEMFSAMPPGEVEARLSGPDTAALFSSPSKPEWRGVIMPMRVL